MAEAPRTLEVNYGGFVVSKANDRFIDDLVSFSEDQETGFFEFSFIIRKATEAAFITEANAVEAAFRKPRVRLQVKFGSGNFLDFNPDDSINTGFNHAPRITKQQDLADSNRSRRYFVRIDFDLPADVHSTDGRRNSRVDLTLSPAEKRTLTISGSYTALTAEGSARAQYIGNIASYETVVQNSLSAGTWEQIDESAEADDQDKIINFRRVYDEILFNQSSVGLDDPDIFKHTMQIRKTQPAPGDDPDSAVKRLAEITVRYSCFVKEGVSVKAKYESSLRDFLISQALSLYGASSGALVSESPDFDQPDQRISVTMTILAQVGGSLVLELRRTTEDNDEKGKVFAPAWTGNPLDYYEFQGHQRLIRTITEVKRQLSGPADAGGGGVVLGAGGAGGGAFAGGVPGAIFRLPLLGGQVVQFGPGAFIGAGGAAAEAPGPSSDVGGFIVIDTRSARTPLRLGTPAHFIDIVDITTVTVSQRINPIAGGGGIPGPS